MHFVLIYCSGSQLGGMQTLAVRMSRWLINNGHEVTLIIRSGEQWAHLLPKNARCIALGDHFNELAYYFHARSFWKSLNLPEPDVIKSFDLRSSWIACLLATLMNKKCKVIAGEYCPSAFKWYYGPESIRFWHGERLYLQNYLNCIPDSAKIFCGVDQIEELEEVHHQKGVLWPTPIDTAQFASASRNARWGKLVSVGRLEPMKEYNLYMIDVVKNLIDKGYNVTWSVYGGGRYETEMRDRIKQHHLERVIFLEGPIPYEQFWRVLQDAHVFIGMGTAILEAALFKVPNLFALPYDRKGLTYGPIYRLPVGSNGQTSNAPTLTMVAEIERLLRLNPAEYHAEEELVYNHVQIHQMDASMRHFLQLVQATRPAIAQGRLHYLANYPLWLVKQAMKWFGEDLEVHHPPTPDTSFKSPAFPLATAGKIK